MRVLAFLVTAILAPVALLAVACSSGSDAPVSGDNAPALTRVGEAGGVTVEGLWLTSGIVDAVGTDVSEFPLDQFVLVEVRFTTHSGDLNEMDMEQAATLSESGRDTPAEAWISLSDDSHHRAGILVFERKAGTGPVALTLDLGDNDVALVWEVMPT